MSYRKHLKVTINRRPAIALLDSGNNYRSLVSHELILNLGIQLEELHETDDKIFTAKAKKTLQILGEIPKPLVLRIPEAGFVTEFEPLVVKNLGMEINLSGPFLKKHDITQVHSEGAIYIGETRVQLEEPGKKEISATRLKTVATQRIPAWTIGVLTLKAPGVAHKLMPAGEGLAVLDEFKLLDYGLQCDMDTVTTCDKEGLCKVTVFNHNDFPVKLPAHKDLGSFTLTCSEDQWEDTHGGSAHSRRLQIYLS